MASLKVIDNYLTSVLILPMLIIFLARDQVDSPYAFITVGEFPLRRFYLSSHLILRITSKYLIENFHLNEPLIDKNIDRDVKLITNVIKLTIARGVIIT